MNELKKYIYAIDEMRERYKEIHPLYQEKYVICIIKDDIAYIYDENKHEQEFAKVISLKFSVPDDIAACFPIDFYEDAYACVMGVEHIGEIEWYIDLLHELVHCYQGRTIEEKIKMSLSIYNREEPRWEIDYKFPYDNIGIREKYTKYIHSFKGNQLSTVFHYRNQLLNSLSKEDQEYMIWQEWKEGFARYCENKIRKKIGMIQRDKSQDKFSRVSFYTSGAQLINKITRENEDVQKDLWKLYDIMNQV